MRSFNQAVDIEGLPRPQSEDDKDHSLANKVYLFSLQMEWLFHSTSSCNVRLYTIKLS